jgi:hypothetical protein
MAYFLDLSQLQAINLCLYGLLKSIFKKVLKNRSRKESAEPQNGNWTECCHSPTQPREKPTLLCKPSSCFHLEIVFAGKIFWNEKQPDEM